MQRSSVVLIGLVMAVVAPRLARAQVTWQVEVVPGEPSEKVPNPPPSLRVKVVGEAAPRADEKDRYRLELDPADNPKRYRSVAPTAVVPFHRSGESLAIVVLVEGHQYYFGNNSYTTDGVENGVIKKSSKGVYDVIANALDTPGGSPDDIPNTISKASLNPSSKGALIVYSVGADVRQPMRPLGEMGSDKLGAQELQKGKTSRDFAEGLRASLAQLKGVGATRKVLFVISDGYSDGGSDEIKAMRKQFDAEKIDIFAFHLEAPTVFIPVNEGDQLRNKQAMQALGKDGGGMYATVTNAEALAKKIGEAVTSINSRFYLTFPGQLTDPRSKVKSGFNWDGKEHEVKLIRDDEPVEKNQLVMFVPVWGQTQPKSNLWKWIVFPLGGVVLLGGIVALLSRKKAPEPVQQLPMPAAPPPPQQPSTIQPAAAGSNKTMAINLNSGDGVPVVGWIVPINGPQQFQTLKLFAGLTKVGNAHGAHILINDAFMSSEHAHVLMSPTGFTLIDNGSTNGTFVNERRVQRHELIDNDVIKFGKTDCKFKTINTDS